MAEPSTSGPVGPSGSPAAPPRVLPWLVMYTIGRFAIAALLILLLWLAGLGSFPGLLFGLLLSIVVRPFVRQGAKRARRSAEKKLRNAAANVAMEMIVAPVRAKLKTYAFARDALAAAR